MQIQRIQSLYILIAAVLMCVFAFVPMLSFEVAIDACPDVITGATMRPLDELGILVPVGLTALFLLVDIFLYNNLTLQRKFLCFCMMLTVISCALVAYITFIGLAPEKAALSWWCVLPIVSLFFQWLGIRGIRHDYNLLRSADRLR